MKRWWLVIALLLSLGANIGILASRAFQPRPAPPAALPPPPDPMAPPDPLATPEGRMPVIQRMADELGLEGEKRAAFVEIQRTFFEQTLAARSRMARLQREVRGQVTAEEPDRDQLDEILVELSEAHTDLERAFVRNLLDSREILGPEQERRFMGFLRRLRHARSDVERRFRERWRGVGERERFHPGPGRRPFGRRPPPEPPGPPDDAGPP